MNYKNIILYILIAFIGILLFNLLTANNLEMQEAAKKLNVEELIRLHFIRVIYGLLLGLLVKWQIVVKCLKGNRQFNFKLIIGSILFLISLIPPVLAMKFTIGIPNSFIGIDMIKAPLVYGSNQLILSVIAGVVIVEGCYKENNKVKQ